jgi:hypothetical protein
MCSLSMLDQGIATHQRRLCLQDHGEVSADAATRETSLLNCCLSESHIGAIALGSDFPIEGINPLLGFYAAVSRLTPDGRSPHGSDGW